MTLTIDRPRAGLPREPRPAACPVLPAVAVPQPWPPRVHPVRADGVFLPEDLGPVDWQLLLREGDLQEFAPGLALPHRDRPTAALRASALARLVPRGWLLGSLTAAWVLLGGQPPRRVDLVGPPDAARPPHRQAVRLRRQVVPTQDRLQLGPVAVTSADRTALDVARELPVEASVPVLRALACCGADLHATRHRLGALAGRRGVVQADQALRLALGSGPRPSGNGGAAGSISRRPAGDPPWPR